jgi:hypothetical protein
VIVHFEKWEMDVRFLLQSGGAVTLKLDPNITVKDTKTILSDQISRPTDRFVLIHLGRILSDSDLLSSLRFDLRPYVYVGAEPQGVTDDESTLDSLFKSLPAPKLVKYRAQLEANPHALSGIAKKVCRGDTALAERLSAAPERFLLHLGMDVSLFTYRSILRDDEDQEPPIAALTIPEDDRAFESYPCNIVADDCSEHHPAERQPNLPARRSEPLETRESVVLSALDVAALRELTQLGVPLERALALYVRLGKNLQATVQACLLMSVLGTS